MQKRGQVSFEYLIVIGFVLLILIPAVILAYDNFRESQDQIRIRQAEQATIDLVREAEAVYYMGPPSRSTFDIYLPSRIFSINLANREAIISLETDRGIEDIAISSRINLTGVIAPTQGNHRITVTATGAEVVVSE